MRRLPPALLLALTSLLVLAATAAAEPAGDFDEGLGWLGHHTDKDITNFGFILIAAFPLIALLLSVLQWRLDQRKEQRKRAAKARTARPEWQGGW
jgi:hypothetical protein